MRTATLQSLHPRRLLVLVTTAALLFALVPGGASADHTVVSDDGDLVTSVRWSGGTRYDTASKLAVEATAATIATPATSAILATGEKFPDALAGSYLAGVVDAPILLTNQASIPAETLGRLTGDTDMSLAAVETIYLLGGPVAISGGVQNQLEGLGFDVVRLAGGDRVATAATIATEAPGGTVGEVDGLATAIVATSRNFPDALVAGAAASAGSLPLLLTDPLTLSEATSDALDELEVEQVLLAGGLVAVSQAVQDELASLGYEVRRVAGATRDHTAVEFARLNVTELGFTTNEVGLARNDAFPDALAFAPFAGREGFSITLTAPAAMPAVTGEYLAELASCRFDTLYIPGGPVAVSEAVETLGRQLLTTTDDCDGVDNDGPLAGSARVVDEGTASTARSEPGPGDASVQVLFEEQVVCTDTVPQQFTFVAGDGIATSATSLRCNGSSTVLLGFPGGTVDDLDGAVITYVRAGEPTDRVYDLASNEAVNNQVIDTFDATPDSSTLIVNTTIDAVDATPGDGVCETVVDGQCSLRAAIMEANTDVEPNRIEVPAGTYDLTIAGRLENDDATGDLDVTTDIDLVATDEAGATIDANGIDRVLDVLGDVSFLLDGFTVTGGDANIDDERGGALRSVGADVTIVSTTFVGNAAAGAGGAVENTGGTMLVDDVAFTDNGTGGNGGALHAVGGETTITGSTATGNVAQDGGAFWIGADGSMAVSDTVVDGNTASGDAAARAGSAVGGGGLSNDGATLNVAGSTISNNAAPGAGGSGGGILSTGATALLTVDGSEISDNTADGAGGGIASHDGELLVGDDLEVDVLRNSATWGGGVQTTGPTAIHASTIADNDAVEGGGLWLGGEVDVLLTDLTVTGNTAQDGGGIHVDGATVEMFGLLVEGNDATGAATASGGGIDQVDGTVLIVGSTIIDNTAQRAGGGIEIAGSGVAVLEMHDSYFCDNVASASPGNGGALHVTAADTVDVTGGIVEENVAASEGGGFWNDAAAEMTITGTYFVLNDAQGDAPDQGGGAIYNDGGRLALIDVHIGDGEGMGMVGVGRPELPPGQLGNTASGAAGSGGGLLSIDGTVTIDSTYEDEVVTRDGAARDRAAFDDDRAARPFRPEQSVVAHNVANGFGGGIAVIDGDLDIDSAVILRNGAGVDADADEGRVVAANPGDGGGIHVAGGATTTLANTWVDGNRAARSGGGIWASATSTTDVLDWSVVIGNLAMGDGATDGGGGIHDAGGVLTLTDSDLVFNQAWSGGGVYADGTHLDVDGNSLLLANFAITDGGGIAAVGATVDIGSADGVFLEHNTAGWSGPCSLDRGSPPCDPNQPEAHFARIDDGPIGRGGGIFQSGGTVELGGPDRTAALVDNSAGIDGGGSWVGDDGIMTVDNTFELPPVSRQLDTCRALSNGAVEPRVTPTTGAGCASGNSAGGGGLLRNGGPLTGGGAFHNAGATLSMTGANIVSNSTTGSGGGVLTTGGGTTTLDATIVEYNRSEGYGGGGVANDSSSTTLTDTKVYQNDALPFGGPGLGGGVLNLGVDAELTLVEGYLARNDAEHGGGIWTDATLSVTGTPISYNVSTVHGGGIAVAGGTTTTTDVGFHDNRTGATGYGGAIHSITGSVVDVTGGSMTANRAEEAGAVWASGIVDLDGATVSGNMAQEGGAFYNEGGTFTFTAVDATNGGHEVEDHTVESAVSKDEPDVRGNVYAVGGPDPSAASATGSTFTDVAYTDSGDGLDEPTCETIVDPDATGLPLGNEDDDGTCFGAGPDATFIVNVTTDAVDADPADGICETAVPGECSLRAAIMQANVDVAEQTIEFEPALGTILLTTAGPDEDGATTGDLDVTQPVTIDGRGALQVVDASGLGDRILDVHGSDVELYSMDLTGGSTTAAGGGMRVDALSDAHVQDSVVRDSTADTGGGIWSNGRVMLSVSDVTDNTATGLVGGGGVHNVGGELQTFGDVSISRNQATGTGASGGGVLDVSGSLLIIEGGPGAATLDGNTASGDGGAIALGGDAAAFQLLTGLVVSNNTADGDGGGIHTASRDVTLTASTVAYNSADEGGGLWNGTGTMQIDGDVGIDTNTATGSVDGRGGGGILNDAGGTLTLVDGSSIARNTAPAGAGGGVLHAGATLSVGAASIIDNDAGTHGGGVAVTSGATDTTLTLATMSENTAIGDGGGLHSDGADVTFVGSVIRGNMADEGGGLWNGIGTLTVGDGAVIDRNTATAAVDGMGGGGIANMGGTLDLDNIQVGGVGAAANSAVGSTFPGSGGGVLHAGGTLTVDDSFIIGNQASRFGGGIQVGDVSGSSVTITNTDFTGNVVTGEAPPAPAAGTSVVVVVPVTEGNGGALHSAGQPVTVIGGTVDGNSADEGGGFWNGTATMAVSGGTAFTNNVATGADDGRGGGALFNDGGTMTLTGVTVGGDANGNQATGAGGGAYTVAGELSLTDVTFAENTATVEGGGYFLGDGGVLSYSGTVTATASTVQGAPVGEIVAWDSSVLIIINGATIDLTSTFDPTTATCELLQSGGSDPNWTDDDDTCFPST